MIATVFNAYQKITMKYLIITLCLTLSQNVYSTLLTFSKQKCETDKIQNNLIVNCQLSVSLEGLQDNLFLKEQEVEAEAGGDFIEQTISPLNGLPNLYHNPFPFPLRLSKLKDNVMTMIDLTKPHHEGFLRWSIPITITTEDGQMIHQTEVIQEFILNEGVLILKKGGLELIRVPLKTNLFLNI